MLLLGIVKVAHAQMVDVKSDGVNHVRLIYGHKPKGPGNGAGAFFPFFIYLFIFGRESLSKCPPGQKGLALARCLGAVKSRRCQLKVRREK